MTPGNFDWFLHAMLYYHTKHVLRKQTLQKEKEEKKIHDDISDNSQDEDSGMEDLNSVD